MVNPHEEYLRLGRDAVTRGTQYRCLFRIPVSQVDLDVIRESLASNRVLGDEGYRKAIGKVLGRPAGIPSMGRPRNPAPDLFES
jgi:putative transposase